MSEESANPDLLQLTRRIFDAASRRDWDAVMDFHTPASVWDASRFEVGVFEGPVAIRGFFEDWIAAYEEFAIELEEVVDLGNGITFVVYRQKGRLFGSSGSLGGREALVYEWAGGMIVSVTAYPDIDAARAAAERLAEERG
jgi:ketosteroid isomerase-like protein